MSFSFDFSKDRPSISEPVPAGTKVLVRMTYTPGAALVPANMPQTPENRAMFAQLTKSKEPSDAYYLKAEFTILRGPYKGRKFWENMTFFGGKVNERGESIAAGITRSNVRSILDASQGLSSKDESPAACAARVLVNGFQGLQSRTFACKIGVEPAKGNYPAKNKLGTILTIDHKDYPKSEAELDNPTVAGAVAAPSLPAVPAPAWAPAPAAASAAPAPTMIAGHIPAAPAPAPALTVTPPAPPAPAAASGMPAWMQA